MWGGVLVRHVISPPGGRAIYSLPTGPAVLYTGQ